MNVTFQESMFYYDCELVFTAADETGRQYVAVHTDDYETGCKYLVAQASPESIAAFREGKIDLRRLLLDYPTHEWYKATLDVNDDIGIALMPQGAPIAACAYIPGAGFYIGTADAEAAAASAAQVVA